MFRVGMDAIVTVLLVFPAAVQAESPKAWIRGNMDGLVALYQHMHARPELSFQEEETAARLAEEWRAAGFQVTAGVGGHGLVGILKNGEGPVVMLRTDMDALPVVEQTGLAYASTVKTKNEAEVEVGVMHACGHDAHMASMVGVVQYLAANKASWRGTVMVVGQPAEERGAGAKAMLADGLFERFPKPDFALAFHVHASLPTGSIGYRIGYSMANVDSVDIVVRGKGGHGAHPQATIDPVVQAAELVLAIQTIISREIQPIEPAVITVGSIHGGTKHNVIGEECTLQLTVRSYSESVRDHLLSAIERKAVAVAEGARAPEPTVTITRGTPSLWNDKDLAERLVPVFRQVVGDGNVTEIQPVMSGEDFSRYGKAGVPIMMFRVGSVSAERLKAFEEAGEPPSIHSPIFYPDAEETLAVSIPAMASAVLELLKP